MAEVHLAQVLTVSTMWREVALKRVLPGLQGDDETFLKMFLDEAYISSRLDHPNIAAILELGELEGRLFMTLEPVFGVSFRRLSERLSASGERIPVAVAVGIAKRVLSALAYAHDLCGSDGRPLRIVHRDVSPENVLIDFNGEIKLIDFGIARAEGRLHRTEAGVVKGRFRYMAPEQVRSERIDGRADIFSVGVMLYEALFQKHPFGPLGEGVVWNEIRVGARPIDPSFLGECCSPVLSEIVLHALQVDPRNRYPDAVSMERALEGFSSSELSPVSSAEIAALVRKVFMRRWLLLERARDEADNLLLALTMAQDSDDELESFFEDGGSGVPSAIEIARSPADERAWARDELEGRPSVSLPRISMDEGEWSAFTGDTAFDFDEEPYQGTGERPEAAALRRRVDPDELRSDAEWSAFTGDTAFDFDEEPYQDTGGRPGAPKRGAFLKATELATDSVSQDRTASAPGFDSSDITELSELDESLSGSSAQPHVILERGKERSSAQAGAGAVDVGAMRGPPLPRVSSRPEQVWPAPGLAHLEARGAPAEDSVDPAAQKEGGRVHAPARTGLATSSVREEKAGWSIAGSIASGSSSEIYLARYTGPLEFRKNFVIKRLLAPDPSHVATFLADGRIGAYLRHPNLIEVLDLHHAGSEYSLILEYVRGWDLERVLDRSRARGISVPFPIACRILSDACAGLAATLAPLEGPARAVRIVRRKLEPHDFLVATRGFVKLTHAWRVRRALIPGHGAGDEAETPSVEETGADDASTVFALGRLLFEMVCLRPWSAEFRLEPNFRTVPRGALEWFDALVGGATNPLHNRRYANAFDFQVALEQAILRMNEPVLHAHVSAWLRDAFPPELSVPSRNVSG